MKKKQFMMAAALLALLLTVAVGGTLAYLIDTTGEVENVFTPSSVPPQITEEFDDDVKSDVKVTNTGNVDAYIRAAIVVTWKQGRDGHVYSTLPVAGTDYEMTIGSDWTKGSDGYYYYKSKVAGGSETTELIKRCVQTKPCADLSYTLNVEILAQSIQAEPASVVTSVWPVTAADDGTLTPQ